MHLRPALIGITLLLAPATTLAGLYDMIHEDVEEEFGTTELEKEVSAYVSALYDEDYGMRPANVDSAAIGQWWKLCEGTDDKDRGTCENLYPTVREILQEESRVRATGRRLQAIATGRELPVAELPDRPLRLSIDFSGILTLWSTGTGSIRGSMTGSLVRTRVLDDLTARPILESLGQALDDLDDEQTIAAVWRYKDGFRLVTGERQPAFPPPPIDNQSGVLTERQFLFKQWITVEDELRKLWDAVVADPVAFEPPLGRGEVAYYIIDRDLIEEELPENVIVWVRIDGNPDASWPLGDAGLHWRFPLDPVLPSLLPEGFVKCVEDGTRPADCRDLHGDPIVGGTYPPEPVTTDDPPKPADGTGLCTHPIGRRGYLCRTIVSRREDQRCPTPEEYDPTAITLTSCQPEDEEERHTLSGPDVCREIPWKEEPERNSEYWKTHCKVEVTCKPNCVPGIAATAQTKPKRTDGVIEICMSTDPARMDVASTYLLHHELTHAYQLCPFPPGYKGYDPDKKNMTAEERAVEARKCCRSEGEAYRAQFDLMEEDGVFTDPATGKPYIRSGIPVTGETAAEVFTNWSCSQQHKLGTCPVSRVYPASFWNEVLQVGKDHLAKLLSTPKENWPEDDPWWVAATCEDARDNPNPRLKAHLEEINLRHDVCAPLSDTTYLNKISNNFCYIGQCAEESQELHRIVGGRLPAGVEDAAFPWDSPLSWTPMGTLLISPTPSQATFPSYRPRLYVEEMDASLCQLLGLPRQAPPILCLMDATRRLGTPISAQLETAQDLLLQHNQQLEGTTGQQGLAPAVGSRLGSALYGSYFHNASRSLAGILGIASSLLTQMRDIDFPTQMCPMDKGVPRPHMNPPPPKPPL